MVHVMASTKAYVLRGGSCTSSVVGVRVAVRVVFVLLLLLVTAAGRNSVEVGESVSFVPFVNWRGRRACEFGKG
jgi:hypothetical protein